MIKPCFLCKEKEESVNHVLLHCKWTQSVDGSFSTNGSTLGYIKNN